MSPAFECSGLMKRYYSALQCNVSFSPEPGTLWMSLMCVVLTYCCGCALFAFNPVVCNGSLCYVQNLVPVSGPVRFPWAYIESDYTFVRDAQH